MSHALSDEQLKGHPRVQFRCARCSQATIVETNVADRTQVLLPMPAFARSASAHSAGARNPAALLGAEGRELYLPAAKTISLSVISGPARGLAQALEKPMVVLGRAADISIQDPQISRWHCAVEVQGELVRLRDLDSSNGTFIGNERIRAAELRHLSEFRLGACVILVTITPKLAPLR
jgi:FHA domain